MGLAVYNGVLLDVAFPPALYKKLLARPLALPDLADIRSPPPHTHTHAQRHTRSQDVGSKTGPGEISQCRDQP